MKKTIFDIYEVSHENETPLLSDFDAEWWSEYVTNFEEFDRFFMHLYKTFVYYNQIPNETSADVQYNFTLDVETLLHKNAKKYTELWRIATIEDNDAYELTNNYDIHETYSGTNASQGAAISGQRTDVTYDETGTQYSSGVNKITGWNSNSENTNDTNSGALGSREDTHQFTKGQQQDTSRTQGQDTHTSRRYGNLGVMTVDDILKKHFDFWQVFDFYQIVFNDICSELLLIGGDCLWQR